MLAGAGLGQIITAHPTGNGAGPRESPTDGYFPGGSFYQNLAGVGLSHPGPISLRAMERLLAFGGAAQSILADAGRELPGRVAGAGESEPEACLGNPCPRKEAPSWPAGRLETAMGRGRPKAGVVTPARP